MQPAAIQAGGTGDNGQMKLLSQAFVEHKIQISKKDLGILNLDAKFLRKWVKKQKEIHDNMCEDIQLDTLTKYQSQLMDDIEQLFEKIDLLTEKNSKWNNDYISIYKEFMENFRTFEQEILYFADTSLYFSMISSITLLLFKFDQLDHATLQLIKLLSIHEKSPNTHKHFHELEILCNIRNNNLERFEKIYKILKYTNGNFYEDMIQDVWDKLDKFCNDRNNPERHTQ